MIGPHGPHFGTLRSCRFAGEMAYREGGDAFGCADEFDWLFFFTARQVLPQRGHGLRSQLAHRRARRLAAGVHDRPPMAPTSAPLEVAVLQAKWLIGKGAMPLGSTG